MDYKTNMSPFQKDTLTKQEVGYKFEDFICCLFIYVLDLSLKFLPFFRHLEYLHFFRETSNMKG